MKIITNTIMFQVRAVLVLVVFTVNGQACAGNVVKQEMPQLEVQLHMSKRVYSANEPIECQIEIRNVGNSKVRIINKFRFPNYYMRFEIKDENGEYVDYVGPIWKGMLDESWLVNLESSNWLGKQMQIYNPNSDIMEQGGQYDLHQLGKYSIVAVYTGCDSCEHDQLGIPTVRSNSSVFEIR